MRTFFAKAIFFSIAIILTVTAALFLPTDQFVRKSLFFSQIDKNNLLKTTPGPRIIFIGGSNLSFGLDGKIIKDSLNINPINTSIHASLGLKYVIKNTSKYIRQNDIVVIAPEYHQFYGHTADGEIELLTMIIDVSPETKSLIGFKQFLQLLKFVPKYFSSKINPLTHFMRADTSVGIYDRLSFNRYGDAYKHWNLKREIVPPITIEGNFNKEIIDILVDFDKEIRSKNAKLFVTYPGYQGLSYKKGNAKISRIQSELSKTNLSILGNPKRYEMPDSLIYNTPYHLTREGVVKRTILLISDIKNQLNYKLSHK
ncbi:hypothetical protein [Pedobacter frigoris]|uniref:hypothetical protein n=1 Tax=Pedobacter frigoris TaxID=2571272 RepID=UPI0029308DA0|nr:hypothetical protein [Pedobacter frigoris]